MNNSMYGSPFPKLNPKVHYKTALERAGFDVNRGDKPTSTTRIPSPHNTLLPSSYNINSNQRQSPVVSKITDHDNGKKMPHVPMKYSQKNMSNSDPNLSKQRNNNNLQVLHSQATGSGSSSMKTPPSITHISNNPYMPNPNNTYHASSNPALSSSKQQQQQQQQQQFNGIQSSHLSTYTQNTSNNNMTQTPMKQMNNNKYDSINNIEKHEKILSPIEKSFMMLTQNDTSSHFSNHQNDQQQQQEQENSVPFQAHTHEHQPSLTDISFNNNYEDTYNNNHTANNDDNTDADSIASLNLQPQAPLNIALESKPLFSSADVSSSASSSSSSSSSSSVSEKLSNSPLTSPIKSSNIHHKPSFSFEDSNLNHNHPTEQETIDKNSIHSILDEKTTIPLSITSSNDPPLPLESSKIPIQDSNNNNNNNNNSNAINNVDNNQWTQLNIAANNHSNDNNTTNDNLNGFIDTNTSTSTSLQVEQLIAQLDDVSFSRNEEIVASLKQNQNQNQNQNEKYTKLTANDISKQHIKKSSAYLSGFPALRSSTFIPPVDADNSLPNIHQQKHLSTDQSSENTTPTTTSGTPIFYKFNTTLPSSITTNNPSDLNLSLPKISISPSPSPSPSPSHSEISPAIPILSLPTASVPSIKIQSPLIEHSRVFQKDTNQNNNITTNSSREKNDSLNVDNKSITQNITTPSNGIDRSPSDLHGKKHENISSPKEKKKFPPGEGPCRTCGLEITGKKIFSKNDNELSGQWHRECFQCTNCKIKFNKRIPCYILNDTPYCQQHFHEENNSICKICSNFIEGKCLENDKLERFHVDCLNCFICHKQILDEYYIFNDHVPLCADHDIDALLNDGLPTINKKTDNLDLFANNNKIMKRRTRLIDFSKEQQDDLL
ncbi:Pxl1p NDAI_0E05000 [Naumovozyma dairenensis CBS 421]|uniref:LIM zinc-binding domain-containing protein n=1 Tax=Naumovozyma dairenensis (strain ATCC 10597 / BCRC 20456 / CBS 421 / NBRC 0211 / NRRL Y-12639) TaxID=1071378 RepID=G0WAP4_NAUDC|nr:hypothetical protein NDAI_0E05000 [Naumovozyma dairenensis CBS 421]CCD25317.1 hypothetical protein NDAI_0E05000 [Naumovozyma dairenensis CBS 421]